MVSGRLIGRIGRIGPIGATLLMWVNPVFAQTAPVATLEAGKVNERVVVQSHPDQSYAVFLPTGYTSDKRWPTIFCLDPRARGKVAIERFVEAADHLGYIVVCSNNSRNGLDWQTISNIFSDFWDDAHARFAIDAKRTYAAGFSGGSRLAATFAIRCRGCLAGIIAAGAGFPGEIKPDANTAFAYFGIAGVDDFNFGEMWELEKKFSQLNTPFRFESFSGGHEWPPADAIKRAVAWLTLQSMKTDAGLRSDEFLNAQFKQRLAFTDNLVAEQHWVEAYKALFSIVRDFDNLLDTSAVKQKADQIKKSAEFKKEEKTEEEIYRRQLREAGEIRASWLKQPETETASLPRHEATLRVAEWRKKRELANDSTDRRLARRIISQLQVESAEAAQAGIRNKDYNVALANLELAVEIDPKNANATFEIARTYALKRQKKSALQFLEQAVSLGFKDSNRLKDEAFSVVSDDPRYQKLLSTLNLQ